MEYNENNKSIAELYSAISDFVNKADVYVANILSNIAFSIREKRNEMKMTQKEFAEFMGVTQGMVSKWERGDYNFTIEAIAEICEKMKMTVDLIIENEDSDARKTYSVRAGLLYKLTSSWQNNNASGSYLSGEAFEEGEVAS